MAALNTEIVCNNEILHTIDFPEWVRQKSISREDDLLQAFTIDLPTDEEAAITSSFHVKCELVATGYAWLQKVYSMTGTRTYVAAMRRYAPYNQLSDWQKELLDKKIKQVKKIYDNWDRIVELCCRSDMTYVDVRRFTLYQLSRACEKRWVEAYNENHMPKWFRRIERQYPLEMVEQLLNNEAGSTDQLLREVNNDIDQVRLIGKDICDALVRRANGTL